MKNPFFNINFKFLYQETVNNVNDFLLIHSAPLLQVFPCKSTKLFCNAYRHHVPYSTICMN